MSDLGDRTAPEVTVIVPAFNAQAHLAHTLDTLLAQRGVTIEVSVVDDRSTDGTRDLVQAYSARDPRVRYSQTPANTGGPAGPRNLGTEQARSEWIAFCDADDLWHPDKLRTQLDCARDHGADLVCTAIEMLHDGHEPRSLEIPLQQPVPVREIGIWQMLLKNRVATSSVLCRRLQAMECGGFNVARDMVAVEDYDLWLRMMAGLGARVVRLEQPLVAYRLLKGSLSASKWRQAIKITRVHRSIFSIKGWQLVFPFLAPFLMACYITSWLYVRRHAGQRA